MDVFLGTIMTVGFPFPPRGWQSCNGQLLSISQNTALFALLGTQYGGDGVNTFGLPDLRGRVAVGAGTGLSTVTVGEKFGSPQVTAAVTGQATITSANLPGHQHAINITAGQITASSTLNVQNTAGVATPVTGSALGTGGGGGNAATIYVANGDPTIEMAANSVKTTVGAFTGATGDAGSAAPTAAPVTGNAVVSLMQPSLGLNYIIATEGIFPSRN